MARFAIGSALLSTAILLIAWVGFAGKLTFAVLGAACLLAGLKWTRFSIPSRIPWLYSAIMGVFASLYLIHALAPETRADAITYHLGMVRHILDHGRLPEHVTFYGVLPQGMEMLFAFATAFGGYSSAKLVHLTFLLGTVPLILHLARRLGLPGHAGPVAAVLYFCSPVVGMSGTSAYNDAALVFYLLAAISLLLEGESLLAGIAAGACYAVKIVGLAFSPLLALASRRWRALLLFCAGAALMAGPHMLRALIQTGNPVAPFFNAWFPNPYFYPLTEGQYHTQVRSYGTNSLGEAVVDLLFHGAKVHGLIGPVFVLLPLALLGIRRPAVRKLLAGGALLSGLWLLNHGARFVMPALPLLSLALAVVLPARVAQVVVLVHALLSWPHALRLNMPGEGSLLAGIPWKAALRIESEDAYLRRVSFDYNVALMLEQHVPRGAKVLDLFGAPEAYLRSRLVGQYQSAEGVRASEALRLAWRLEPGMLYFYDARWPVQGLTAVRIALAENGATPWSVQEVQLMRNGEAVRAGPGWEVDAEPNIWESNLAADRNLLTAWSTRQPMRPGDWWQVDFQKPELLDSLRVLSPWAQRPKRFEVLGRTTDGFWRKLADTARGAPHIPMNPRFAATRTLARWGIRHILTTTGPAGFGPVGASMLDAPHDWGLELLGCHEQVCLFKVR